MLTRKNKRQRKHKKILAGMQGTKEKPRLYVFRSNQHIYAQLVDDTNSKILASVSDKNVKIKKGVKKTDLSKEVGKIIAKTALDNKIEKVIFDRGGFVYHGRIKSLAEGAREAGLKF